MLGLYIICYIMSCGPQLVHRAHVCCLQKSSVRRLRGTLSFTLCPSPPQPRHIPQCSSHSSLANCLSFSVSTPSSRVSSSGQSQVSTPSSRVSSSGQSQVSTPSSRVSSSGQSQVSTPSSRVSSSGQSQVSTPSSRVSSRGQSQVSTPSSRVSSRGQSQPSSQ